MAKQQYLLARQAYAALKDDDKVKEMQEKIDYTDSLLAEQAASSSSAASSSQASSQNNTSSNASLDSSSKPSDGLSK